MRKTSIVLMLFISVSANSQKVYNRWVDSNQHIWVMSTLDTLARGEKECLVGGMIYNADSMNFYCFCFGIYSAYKIDPLSPVYIEIILDNGEILAMTDSSDKSNSIRENGFTMTDYITTSELKKLEKSPVSIIRVHSKDVLFLIKPSYPYANTLSNLSKLLLNTNVYEEFNSTTYEDDDLKVFVSPKN